MTVLGENVEICLGIALTLLSFILITTILKTITKESSSSEKMVNIVCVLIVSSYLITIYINYIEVLKQAILTQTEAISILSPFMVSILMLTGLSITVGLIQPVLLLLLNVVSIAVPYIVIPLISLSVVSNLISAISDTVNLKSFAKTCNKVAVWSVMIIFTVFLALMGLESAVATSIDTVAVKTSQAAISDLVPLVGKFVSDSIEFVFGATSVIGKATGVIGIIIVFVIALSPILKLAIISAFISFLTLICEMMNIDKTITNVVHGFSSSFKTMLGILTGITVMYIVSIGILINLFKQVVA